MTNIISIIATGRGQPAKDQILGRGIGCCQEREGSFRGRQEGKRTGERAG